VHVSRCFLEFIELNSNINDRQTWDKGQDQSEVQTLCCASCNSKSFPTVVMPIADVLLHIAYEPIPDEYEQIILVHKSSNHEWQNKI
jgi:hypothetical protein